MFVYVLSTAMYVMYATDYYHGLLFQRWEGEPLNRTCYPDCQSLLTKDANTSHPNLQDGQVSRPPAEAPGHPGPRGWLS